MTNRYICHFQNALFRTFGAIANLALTVAQIAARQYLRKDFTVFLQKKKYIFGVFMHC